MMLLSTLRRTTVAVVVGCLLGVTNAAAANGKSSADYFIKSLPGQPEGPLLKMHAGHITVDQENNGNLFFWHIDNNHIDAKQRTVIWINGGPGCSSMDGALMEIGPYRVSGEKLVMNPGSWNEFANLLFVDNPVGTGFSYTNTNALLHELGEMAAQFIEFLEKFFGLFPEYEEDELFISGESYAGQHIPYIAKAILDRNAATSGRKWNIAGLLIGNGWIDPVTQYPAYLAYAYEARLITHGSDIAARLETQQKVCLARMAAGDHHIDISECEQILQEILRETAEGPPGSQTCYNMYDIRLKDKYPSCGMNWPPDLADVTPYLRRHDVVEALHINPDKKTGWSECSGSVSSVFRARNSPAAINLLPGLLEHMPVLLFSGEKDLICNHIGTENLIHNMTWLGGTGFETEPGVWAPRTPWVFEGEQVGYYQTARNLSYVLIHNSSHMVPFDLPRQTRDMLDRFVGVDIGGIGGAPSKATIGGQDSPITSVGGTPNSTLAVAEEEKKVEAARWQAYYRSGEIALVFVAIAAVLWGIFIWRQRSQAGLRANGGIAYGALRKRGGDLEEADFDESELDQLTVASPGMRAGEDDRYSIGGDSEDDEDEGPRQTKGKQRMGNKEN